MSTPKEIVDYAISQIGTAENPLGSNRQKYGALIDSTDWYLYREGTKIWRHLVNGYDWCTQLVDASFIEKYGIEKARKLLYRPIYNNYGAVVKYAFDYFRAANKGYTKDKYDPKPGDVIYFQNSKGLSHTGIVVAVTATQVTTVEGNSGTNNWYVAKHTYSKTSSYIYGYGHPDYDDVPQSDYPTTPFTIDVISSGKTGLRNGPYSDTKYLGTINSGSYTITEVQGDYGRFDAWVYLPDANIVIDGQTMDGYTVGKEYTVTVGEDVLNVRTAPGVKNTLVTSLKTGTVVRCKALIHDADGNTWMRIDKPTNGWVACLYEGHKYVS
jgi:hypothetical protein